MLNVLYVSLFLFDCLVYPHSCVKGNGEKFFTLVYDCCCMYLVYEN